MHEVTSKSGECGTKIEMSLVIQILQRMIKAKKTMNV